VPEHLIVIGGGYVELEFGHAMRRFGSRVTILVRRSQRARHEDSDVADEILRLFRDDGIQVMLETEVLKVEGLSGREIKWEIRDSRGTRILEGSDILAATGRVPNTKGLDLDKAGVELDGRGYMRVNERLQTTADGTWAMGECAGSPHFTHVSFDDFRIVHDNLNGGNRTTKDRHCCPKQDRVCRGLLKAKAFKRGKRGFQMEVSYCHLGRPVQITSVREEVAEMRGAWLACRRGYRAMRSNRGR